MKYENKIDDKEFVDILIEQYTSAVGTLNDLFRIAPDLCYKDDGVGCCSLDTKTSKRGIVGPAKDKILKLRQNKVEDEEIEDHNACDYHKLNEGCILEDLKSPICVAHYCKGDIKGTSYDQGDVFDSLKHLLNTEASTGNLKDKISDGWKIVEEIGKYIRDIERELILSNPEKYNDKVLETHR